LFAPHTYIFVLRPHPVRGESHNQRNTTGEVATMQSKLGVNKQFYPVYDGSAITQWSGHSLQ